MCQHLHVIGDNYGRTCTDCGEVLAGYGYFAEGSKICLHQFVQEIEGDGESVCIYCEMPKDPSPIPFRSEFAQALQIAHPKLADAISSAIARGIPRENILGVIRRVNSVPIRTLAESFVEEQFNTPVMEHGALI